MRESRPSGSVGGPGGNARAYPTGFFWRARRAAAKVTGVTQPVTVEDLRRLVEAEVVARQPAAEPLWRPPLLATAPADERFDELRRIAVFDHLLPRDVLDTARSVVALFVPFSRALQADNRAGERPSLSWARAYETTNDLLEHLAAVVERYLVERGHRVARRPPTHDFDEARLVSRWSHKHVGHLAGLGRIGKNAQLITPAGCAGRLASLVTDADLGAHPIASDFEPCRLPKGRECRRCMERCPIDALGPDGVDRSRCYARLHENRAALGPNDLLETTHVCGKCVVGVPCAFDPPFAR